MSTFRLTRHSLEHAGREPGIAVILSCHGKPVLLGCFLLAVAILGLGCMQP